jgi:WD40 repeat protein
LLLVLAGSLLFLFQAKAYAGIAKSLELATSAMAIPPDHPDSNMSLYLALAAFSAQDTHEAIEALQYAVQVVQRPRIESSAMFWNAVFTPDGKKLLTSSGDGTACIFNVDTGERLQACSALEGVTASAFSPDGTFVAVGKVDGSLRIIQTNTGNSLMEIYKAVSGEIRGLTFSPDGKRIVIEGSDGAPKIWNINSAEMPATVTGHDGPVRSLSFSPNGKLIGTAGVDGKAKLVSSDGRVITLKGHKAALTDIAFHPNDTLAATSSMDGTVRLWNVSNGQLVSTLADNPNGVTAIAFSPDGTNLASGALDGSVRIRNVDTRVERFGFRNVGGERCNALAFSPDSRLLAVVLGPTMRIYELRPEVLRKRALDLIRNSSLSPRPEQCEAYLQSQCQAL